MSGSQDSIVINHSIRKALWKLFPRDRWDGLCKSCWIGSSLLLCPAPPVLLLGYYPLPVTDILWYRVLGLLTRTQETPPSADIPYRNIPQKSLKTKDLLPFRWHRRILIPTIDTPPLDTERKVIAGAKTTAEHPQSVAFCSLFRFLFISLQSCVQRTWIFFPLHFLEAFS